MSILDRLLAHAAQPDDAPTMMDAGVTFLRAAGSEIVKLRAERERFRAALEQIAKEAPLLSTGEIQELAADALAGPKR